MRWKAISIPTVILQVKDSCPGTTSRVCRSLPSSHRRGKRGKDEFLSRPRFLAVSEFGPQALVYHEGAQYRINKVNLSFEEEGGAMEKFSMKYVRSVDTDT